MSKSLGQLVPNQNISKQKLEHLKELYKKRDPYDQGVTKTDLFILFKESGFLVTEQTKLDIITALGNNKNLSKIDF